MHVLRLERCFNMELGELEAAVTRRRRRSAEDVHLRHVAEVVAQVRLRQTIDEIKTRLDGDGQPS